MNNVSIAAMTISALSFLLAAGCVGADPLEDIAQDDIAQDDIAQDDIAQDDGALGESRSAVCDPNAPEGPGVAFSSCRPYCVYLLNGDSSVLTFGCHDTAAEAIAYKDSFVPWRLVAHFDTIKDGVSGWVEFLHHKDLPCAPSRKYEIPDLRQRVTSWRALNQ
jgi:hypothetical protein